jgi:hypothetical protein
VIKALSDDQSVSWDECLESGVWCLALETLAISQDMPITCGQAIIAFTKIGTVNHAKTCQSVLVLK